MDPRTDRLVLDIGNSRTKLGLFSAGRLVRHALIANGDLSGIRELLGATSPERVVIGSVAHEDPDLMKALDHMGAVQVITGESPSHLNNLYATPATLGADRWANAVGASLLFPGRPVLAISLGTCVIYDLVDGHDTYRGGIISPGFRMRARAMGEFTAQLPMVEPEEDPSRIGLSTLTCLSAGVHHGLRAELLTTIAEIRQQHPGLAVVLTGGDAPRFARGLENGIFAHPFLTLFGLHALSLFDRPTAGTAVPG
jgi:type III pantothenate kinase